MTNPHYPFVTVPTKLKYENLDRPWTDLHYEADLVQISSGNVGLIECSSPRHLDWELCSTCVPVRCVLAINHSMARIN